MFPAPRIYRLFMLAGLGWLLGVCPVFGAGSKMLRGHLLREAQTLVSTGGVPATNEVRLALGLGLRDPAGLDEFLAHISDPADPSFRRYLTPEEFTARFGPTEADYAAAKNFALTNGFRITGTHGNRLLLDVAGPAAKVERAFHLKLRRFRHPSEAREFFAPDAEPTVDASLLLVDVSGLNTFSTPHPRVRKKIPNTVSTKASAPKSGSGSGGTYVGTDFRNAYVPGTPLTGAGQMVGLVQFDGFYSNDIVAYEDLLPGAPRVPLVTVLLDNFDGIPTAGPDSGNIEVSLDIEMAIAMAPGLDRIVVFEGNSAPGFFFQNDVLSQMAASNLVKNLSCSWGWSGGPTTTTENIFKQMIAQGQSFFNASGDSAAFTAGVNSTNGVDNPSNLNAPSSSPFITQVGGTTLSMTGGGAAYFSETVWNDGSGFGSSGGVSSFYSTPSWQTNISIAANLASNTKRNIPDVALTADNIFIYYNNGGSSPVGGTSCAAPLWAGFMALANQQAALQGRAPVGFANPSLYAIARSAGYTNCFRDTTTGNNFSPNSPGQYSATAGYDLCTGLGTPRGTNLINALVSLTDTLTVYPGGFNFSGFNNGPFAVTSQTFLLTNIGAFSFNWRVSNIPAWLTVLPANGTLVAGGFTNVTVSLNSATSNLIGGNTFRADILFTNVTSGISQARAVNLQVFSRSILQNGGFENGDFSGWTLLGNTTNIDSIFNIVTSAGTFSGGANFVHTGTYGAALGDTNIALLTQNIATIPGQRYQLSFWLDNPVNGAVQVFLVNWNTNSFLTNQIYFRSNPPVIPWTNISFTLTAGGTNTALQFGAENQPNFFGLDDVMVTPIPVPSLTSVTAKTNSFSLTWSTVPGIAYQIEYKTNLLQPSWLLLRSLTASNYSVTATDTNVITNSPQRFYRIVEP